MKNNPIVIIVTLLSFLSSSCTDDAKLILTPPSWRGFDYAVKKSVPDGKPGESVQIKRGPVEPGDDIRLYAVRKNPGTLVGQMHGDFYLKYTIVYESGVIESNVLTSPAESIANSTLDGWEDPYATFSLPSATAPYVSYELAAACRFTFATFGSDKTEIDTSDQTSHEDPYFGHICTNLAYFHPYNGGIAQSGWYEMEYHTIYYNSNN